MIGTAAACLGYRMHVFCPDADSPAFHVAGNYAPPPSPFQTTHRGS
jgi:phosphoribosylaminoimidazole carboxylase (NCAIR synthetase)